MQLGFNKIGEQLIPVESEPTHIYVIGQPGTGKKDTLIRWAVDDIYAGRGLASLDPSGDAEELIVHIPPARWHDVIYLDSADRRFPFGLNRLSGDDKTEIIATVLDTIEEHLAIWRPPHSFDAPNETLLGIDRSRP
jgi:hypothetical protein